MIDMDAVTELKEFADAVAKNGTNILVYAKVLSVLCSVYLAVVTFVNAGEDDQATLRQDLAAARAVLRLILDWADTEKKPLRKQEIDCIRSVLARETK